ncbi:MAG: TetR/AcrR family transcriptional regulator, partial [Acetobacteraceae bacterium]
MLEDVQHHVARAQHHCLEERLLGREVAVKRGLRHTCPRRQQNRLNRERQIFDAALTVFAAQGYSGTTMDAVAAGAGVTKPTLYSYFPSKESLFQA